LYQQVERLQHTIKAVEELMDAHRDGIVLTAEEQVEIFGTTAFDDEYADEARERWGDTDAWRQSRERVAMLNKQDWQQIKAEQVTLLSDLAQAKRDDVRPGSAASNNWPRGTADPSNASTTAATKCGCAWSICTWPTSASRGTTTMSSRAWPSSCMMSSGLAT
jgi:hypothetical protein